MNKQEKAYLTKWFEAKLYRKLTPEELQRIRTWSDWGFDVYTVKLAFNFAMSINHSPQLFRYVQTEVLQPWYQNNIKTIDQALALFEID